MVVFFFELIFNSFDELVFFFMVKDIIFVMVIEVVNELEKIKVVEK